MLLSSIEFGQQGSTKILLLHGIGGVAKIWRPIALSLEKEMQILALDQRGHGGSRQIPDSIPEQIDPFSPEEFAKDIAETLENERFFPAYVIGHSMGARTAAAFGALFPKLTLGVILIDLGFEGLAGGGFGERLRDFLAVLPESFSTREDARKFMTTRSPDASISQYLMAVSVTNSDGSLSFPFERDTLIRIIDSARGISIRPWIERSVQNGVRVLALRGAKSTVWSKAEFEQEKLRWHNKISFAEVENAGHGLPFENKERFLSVLREFCLVKPQN